MANRTDAAVAIGAAVAVTGAVVVASGAFSPRTFDTTGMSDADIARFLTQCTFGVTDADIAAVRAAGSLNAWIDQQIAMTPFAILDWIRKPPKKRPFGIENHGAFVEGFWTRAITGPDQLRQRMQFAMSQIFVVTRETEELEFNGSLATTNYYDLLGRGCFGNFRDLLGQVALNPMMGIFLSYVENEKEDPTKGRTPDENFARELMQLFTLGTVMLNDDGTPQLDASGKTIPTYSHDDIAGLAKVFTGISWFSPTPDDGTFLSSAYAYFDQGGDNGKPVQMIFYPTHHSISAKSFLGQTIAASAALKKTDTAKVAAEFNFALDTVFNHQNCPPYIATRLIKMFVTSNPSPAYVGRVAAVFKDNGNGVRGDLTAVFKAIILDDEARNTAAAQANPTFGKLREGMIKMSNWARTFAATSKNGFYDIGETGAPQDLSQGILDAPSVFNFWRANYVPPHTRMGAISNPLNPTIPGLTAPEFQAVNELSTASFVNLMFDVVNTGAGVNQKTFSGPDVISAYTNEVALADNPPALLDRLNLLLFYGQMSSGLRTQILNAVNGVAIPSGSTVKQSQIDAAKLNRVKLAVYLSLISGEYAVQR